MENNQPIDLNSLFSPTDNVGVDLYNKTREISDQTSQEKKTLPQQKASSISKKNLKIYIVLASLAIAGVVTGVYVNENQHLSFKDMLNQKMDHGKLISQIENEIKKIKNPQINSSASLSFLPYNSNQTSDFSKKMVEEKNYFMSLVSKAEGFSKNIYKDNVGYAFGFGYNFSVRNNIENTTNLKPLLSPNQFSTVVNFNSNKTKLELDISDAKKITEEIKNGYIKSAIKVLGNPALSRNLLASKKLSGQELYSLMSENEKSAFVYHVYKVGEAGAKKYSNLNKNMVDYLVSKNNPIQNAASLKSKAQLVASSFTYNYKLGDKTIVDSRASTLISSMFLDVDAFSMLVGSKPISSSNDVINKLKETGFIDYGIVSDLKISDNLGEARVINDAVENSSKINLQIVTPDEASATLKDKIKSSRDVNKVKKNDWRTAGQFFQR